LRAIVDSMIRIPLAELDDEAWAAMSPMLSIPNREKEAARKEKRYGWTEMPDEIQLWEADDRHLIVPRGFRDPLASGFRELGVPVEWVDARSSERTMAYTPPFGAWPHQDAAAERALGALDGIVEAPAGAGKTGAGLELIRRAGQARNLVIVNEIGVARQWLAEADQFLGPGFGYGLIGGNQWTEGRLTVATLQTLYSRMERLDGDGWWDRWGVVILDECHHQTARTFIEVMQRFPARIRIGLSATPDKTGDFEVAQGVLGDVIHRTTRHELRELGILMRPTIEVVDTDFHADYWGTHDATRATKYVCQKPGCELSGVRRHGHRNNYTQMLRALVEDRARNLLVARKIASRAGHRQIVVSKQRKQLERIAAAMEHVGFPDPVLWLTGGISEDDRMEVRERILEHEGSVVLTTIADEAFNVPPLDTLHMPFPTRNVGAIRQRIGRVERFYEGKKEPVAFDYRDWRVGVLQSQYNTRRWEVYAPEVYRVRNDREESA
jgi:superfamily II DNA or RNA helicase